MPTNRLSLAPIKVPQNATPEVIQVVGQVNKQFLELNKRFQNLTDGLYVKNNPYSSLVRPNFQKFVWLAVTGSTPTDSWRIDFDGHDVDIGPWPVFTYFGNTTTNLPGSGIIVPVTAGAYTVTATNIEAVGGTNALITAYQDADTTLPLIVQTLTNNVLGTVYTYNFTIT